MNSSLLMQFGHWRSSKSNFSRDEYMKSHLKKLKQKEDEIVLDYESFALSTKELTKERQKALVASRTKAMFLANMSHEIRTPMNGIIGFIDLLLEDKSIVGNSRETLKLVQVCGDNLLLLINDVLDYAKMESGELLLNPQPFELVKVIESAIESVSLITKEKKLAISYSIDPGTPTVT